MHEASRIAQAIMQREAAMAVVAAAGERVDRAKADKLPPTSRTERTRDAPEDRRHRREHRDDDEAYEARGQHVDLSA
jgi:hypothetical protein